MARLRLHDAQLREQTELVVIGVVRDDPALSTARHIGEPQVNACTGAVRLGESAAADLFVRPPDGRSSHLGLVIAEVRHRVDGDAWVARGREVHDLDCVDHER